MNSPSTTWGRTRCARTVLLGGALLSGCVVPLPEHGDGKSPFIVSSSVERLEAGKASRADVVMLLGEPSARRDDDRVIEYSWSSIVGFWGLGYGAGGDIRRTRMLCLEFDDRGILARKTLSSPGFFGGKPESCPVDAGNAEPR